MPAAILVQQQMSLFCSFKRFAVRRACEATKCKVLQSTEMAQVPRKMAQVLRKMAQVPRIMA